MDRALTVDHVTILYDRTVAVHNISFSVKEGEFIAIAGPNGGGKSTLVKAILGLKSIASGTIKIFGEDLKKAKGMIGYVPQQTAFDSTFPIVVRDVILMGRLPQSLGFFYRYTHEDKKRVNEVMKELKIEDLADRAIGELSGGQRQKVLLARALVTDPKILLLDEPTASLDPPSREQIYEILKGLNHRLTILMISHDDQHISDYATSVIYINKELIYKGEDLKRREKMMTT